MGLLSRLVGVGNDNNDNNLNANNQCNNNRRARGMATRRTGTFSYSYNKKCSLMKTYTNLYEQLCSWKNLLLAYNKARTHKNNKSSVKKFSKHYAIELALLRHELCNKTYQPRPLKTFILRDPKTRTICVSDFRDRVVHHALINILQPIFEPRFISDSYASRKNKGTLKAIQRFDTFERQVTINGTRKMPSSTDDSKYILQGYVFKADIYHYFESVDHEVLLNIISRRIKDDDILWLIKQVLGNYKTDIANKGMPLGNWTSQFFANIYLNELDQFVKQQLRIKYYIRYVDDFVILHNSKFTLQNYEIKIREFISKLKLMLHPNKCSISPLHRGTAFLGYRIYYHHKLVRLRNLRKVRSKLKNHLDDYENNLVDATKIFSTLRGWRAYAMHANTHRLREQIMRELVNELLVRNKLRGEKRSIMALREEFLQI